MGLDSQGKLYRPMDARVAVEICQMSPDAAQIEMPINRPQKMILRDMIFQREFVEQRCLRFLQRLKRHLRLEFRRMLLPFGHL